MTPSTSEETEDDMARLTNLNESSVLKNLRQRYYSDMIYTYSGLFCVVINPYKQLPIYSEQVIKEYNGKAREECKPHVFAVTDTAYRAMMSNRVNQSILCTGESGAGKTENTKRVIQYLAHVAGAARVNKYNSPSKSQLTVITELESQLLRANPILEAFGNSKTVKNDNSSRFGKFIRVNFDQAGFICGAHIETYLLEKSRTCRQGEDERSFHIFYQLLRGASQLEKEKYFLRGVNDYKFLNHGGLQIPGVNDAAEYQQTLKALKVMGLEDEIESIMKVLSAILLLGNLEFKSESTSNDQATIVNEKVAEQICRLLGLQVAEFTKAVLLPHIGSKHLRSEKSQDVSQAKFSVEAISKVIYERLFKWLVGRLNEAMDKTSAGDTSSHFIGILDISGFEINKKNSFEQLCINYTNENLQQFFNQTMFIHEQEEYKREGIEWQFIDFGLDLQPTIDLIDKPLGVLSLLDEECLFPKATDRSLVEKIIQNQAQHPKFVVPDVRSRSDFAVIHYAGRVDYCADQWIMKNQDPLNNDIVELLQKSSVKFVGVIWEEAEFAQSSKPPLRTEGAMFRTKGGMFRTITQLYKEQLGRLMKLLQSTSPHFIRCIIPNYKKKAGELNETLVLEQLKCNGVLEGIRICRQGFPSRIAFTDFCQRYKMLAANVVPAGIQDAKEAARRIVSHLKIAEGDYRVGMSKVFFRAGVIARLDGELDRELERRIIDMQVRVRQFLAKSREENKAGKGKEVALMRSEEEKAKWLQKQLDQRDCEHDEEMEDQRRDFEKQINELLQKHTEDVEAVREQHENAKKGMQQQIDELTAQIDQMKREATAQQDSQKQELDRQLLEARSKAQRENEKLNQLIKDMEKKLAESVIAVEKSAKEKKAALDQLAVSQEKLIEEERARNKLVKSNQDSDTKILDLEERLKREKDQRLESDTAKRQLQAELSDANEQLSEKNLQSQKDAIQVAKLQKELADVRQQVDVETQKGAELKRQIRHLDMRLKDAQEELKAEEERRQKAERQCRNLTSDAENVRPADNLDQSISTGAMRRKDEEVKLLQNRLDQLGSEHEEEMEKMRSRFQKQTSELVRKHAEDAEAARERFENTKKGMQQQIDELTAQIDRTKLDTTTLNNRKQELDRQLLEAKAQLEGESATADKYKEYLANECIKSRKFRQQLNDKEDEVEAERATVRTLERKIAELNDTCEDMKRELEINRLRSARRHTSDTNSTPGAGGSAGRQGGGTTASITTGNFQRGGDETPFRN